MKRSSIEYQEVLFTNLRTIVGGLVRFIEKEKLEKELIEDLSACNGVEPGQLQDLYLTIFRYYSPLTMDDSRAAWEV